MPINRQVTLVCESCGFKVVDAIHQELGSRNPGGCTRVRGIDLLGGIFAPDSDCRSWQVSEALLFCSDACQEARRVEAVNVSKESRMRAVAAIRALPDSSKP